jgi:BirA family transcriptional regulator, biotin operon repressor / biotin---[acetyl-CoA-carboxylase] ligase
LYKILAKTLFVGKKLVFLPSCHSTNEEAATLQKNDSAPEGTIIITDNQTSGKGQRGNTWESLANQNLTFSVLMKPSFLPVSEQFLLNMAVSLGILDYLKSIQNGFLIKWPNDMYYQNSKTAGILIQNSVKESRIENSIVGIGLNVNQTSFKTVNATSLSLITGKTYSLETVLEALSLCLEWRYIQLKKGNVSVLKSDYLNNLLGFGEERLYKSVNIFNGRIIGVTDTGLLQMETQSGLKNFNFKEVEFL